MLIFFFLTGTLRIFWQYFDFQQTSLTPALIRTVSRRCAFVRLEPDGTDIHLNHNQALRNWTHGPRYWGLWEISGLLEENSENPTFYLQIILFQDCKIWSHYLCLYWATISSSLWKLTAYVYPADCDLVKLQPGSQFCFRPSAVCTLSCPCSRRQKMTIATRSVGDYAGLLTNSKVIVLRARSIVFHTWYSDNCWVVEKSREKTVLCLAYRKGQRPESWCKYLIKRNSFVVVAQEKALGTSVK